MQWGGESRRKVGLLRRQCELGRDGEVVDEKDIVFSVLTNQSQQSPNSSVCRNA